MTIEQARELLQCPFCGGKPEYRWHSDPECWIECSECFAVGPNDRDTTTDQNVAAWNTRARTAHDLLAKEAISGTPFATETPAADGVDHSERLNKALRTMFDDYQTSDNHHPHHVLVPFRAFVSARAHFDAIAATQAPDTAGEARDTLRQEIINSPETADFMAAVPLEAAHQRERWGVEHDAGKQPEDWFWLIGYLAGKALHAAKTGDENKALHHTISTAAALANWHAALAGRSHFMRPGIEPPAALTQGQSK